MTATRPRLLPKQAAHDMAACADAAFDRYDAAPTPDPDAAVAGAMAEAGMPAKFAAHIVNAFNVGLAAKQRLTAADTWAKAASYVPANVDRVLARLGSPAAPTDPLPASAKLAAARGYDDYDLPPAAPPAAPPKAMAADLRALYAAFDAPPPGNAKVAAVLARPPVEKRVYADPAPTPTAATHAYRLAAIAAAVRDAYDPAAPAEYAGAKRAAVALYPATAPTLFERAEATWSLREKRAYAEATAGDAYDVTAGRSHPIVRLAAVFQQVRDEAAVRARPVEPVKRAAAAATPAEPHPLLAPPAVTPVRPETNAAFAAFLAKKAAPSPSGPAGGVGPMSLLAKPLSGFLSASQAGRERVDQALNAPTHAALTAAFGNVTAPAAHAASRSDLFAKARQSQLESLVSAQVQKPFDDATKAVNTVDEQDHVARLLADPAFARADPVKVLEAYREVRGLAPHVMANPAAARQIVKLRTETGPLSLFDLDQITKVEKNLADIRRASRED